uniref:Ig-like domain-containing protein n=1 Tax=Sinocyclocheilus rhinocerous TaxID=307959 RepID=A0A673JCU5_9TELE
MNAHNRCCKILHPRTDKFALNFFKLCKLLSLAIAKDDDGWLMKAPTEVRAMEPLPNHSKFVCLGKFLCCSLAAPRILSLSAEGTEASGFKAVCHVQGSPLPDVQWIEPDGVQKGDTSFPLSQDTTGQYRASSQLLDLKPGRQYICAASNSLGKDQATL